MKKDDLLFVVVKLSMGNQLGEQTLPETQQDGGNVAGRQTEADIKRRRNFPETGPERVKSSSWNRVKVSSGEDDVQRKKYRR